MRPSLSLAFNKQAQSYTEYPQNPPQQSQSKERRTGTQSLNGPQVPHKKQTENGHRAHKSEHKRQNSP